MAGISFDEEQVARPSAAQGPSGIAGWMIRKGIAKDEKGANTFLVYVVAGGLALTGLVFLLGGGSGARIDAEERLRLEASTPFPR